LYEQVEDYPTLLKIDLIRLSDGGGEFRETILRTGKILYEAA
jgi:hypothetical protein